MIASVLFCFFDLFDAGRNNAYLMNSSHELAICYNDVSVLENFHASSTFKTINRPDCNILAGLHAEDVRAFRKHAIDMILETDMSKHFPSISKFRVR